MNCTECQLTCDNQNVKCEVTQCSEGCGCPANKVLNGDKCIEVTQCPCHFNGQTYRHGNWIKRDCNYWWVLWIFLRLALKQAKLIKQFYVLLQNKQFIYL